MRSTLSESDSQVFTMAEPSKRKKKKKKNVLPFSLNGASAVASK